MQPLNVLDALSKFYYRLGYQKKKKLMQTF